MRRRRSPPTLLAKTDEHDLVTRAGCPQKWAYHEGIGCALLRKPDLVRDLVRTTKQRLGWNFPVSVKIRIDDDPACVSLVLPLALFWTDGLPRVGGPTSLSLLRLRAAPTSCPCMAGHDINLRTGTPSTPKASPLPRAAPRVPFLSLRMAMSSRVKKARRSGRERVCAA